MLKIFKQSWKYGWNTVRGTLLVSLLLSIAIGLIFGVLGKSRADIGIFTDENIGNIFIIGFMVWLGVMIALLVQTVLVIMNNLNDSMFGKEAFLTHTLPVHSWELLGGKALGTWIFGVFMLFIAFINSFLFLTSDAAGTGVLGSFIMDMVKVLPKLGEYHFSQLATGTLYLLYGIGAFLLGSLLLVMQLQFIFIAARQFGKYHVAGGVIVFVVLIQISAKLNQAISGGFLVVLLMSVACFLSGNWLLKNRMQL